MLLKRLDLLKATQFFQNKISCIRVKTTPFATLPQVRRHGKKSWQLSTLGVAGLPTKFYPSPVSFNQLQKSFTVHLELIFSENIATDTATVAKIWRV